MSLRHDLATRRVEMAECDHVIYNVNSISRLDGQVDMAVALCACVQEVAVSNIDRRIGYPDSLCRPTQFFQVNVKLVPQLYLSALFQILFT